MSELPAWKVPGGSLHSDTLWKVPKILAGYSTPEDGRGLPATPKEERLCSGSGLRQLLPACHLTPAKRSCPPPHTFDRRLPPGAVFTFSFGGGRHCRLWLWKAKVLPCYFQPFEKTVRPPSGLQKVPRRVSVASLFPGFLAQLEGVASLRRVIPRSDLGGEQPSPFKFQA